MKTSELTGPALDWAVAKCEGYQYAGKGGLNDFRLLRLINPKRRPVSASIDWSQGGPIIEREEISINRFEDYPNWTATHHHDAGIRAVGQTPLIAAMRVYVASKLGNDIEIPKELQ